MRSLLWHHYGCIATIYIDQCAVCTGRRSYRLDPRGILRLNDDKIIVRVPACPGASFIPEQAAGDYGTTAAAAATAAVRVE